MKKKLFYFTILAISVLGLTACGELKGTDDKTDTENVGKTQNEDSNTDDETSENESINSNYVLLEKKYSRTDQDYVTYTKYSYGNDNELLEEFSYNDNDPDTLLSKTTYEYENGTDVNYSASSIYSNGIIQTEYTFNPDGAKTSAKHYDDSGNLTYTETWTYNDDGLAIEYTSDYDGNKKEIYTYSSDGTMLSLHEYFDDVLYYEKEWREDGQTILMNGYDGEKMTNSIKYEYDDAGKVLTKCNGQYSKSLDENANIVGWTSTTYYYTYDDNGFLVKEEGIRDDDGYKVSITTYINDANGSKIDELVMDGSGKVGRHRGFENDDEGRMIKLIFNPESISESEYIIYGYDPEGNKCTDLRYSADGEIIEGEEKIYDKNGNLYISRIYNGDGYDAYLVESITERNEDGKPIHVTETYDDELHREWNKAYDEFGNLIKDEDYIPDYGYTGTAEYTYGYINE